MDFAVKKVMIAVLVFLVFPSLSQAAGNREQTRQYEFSLIENFEPIIKNLGSSDLSASQAKTKLGEIRKKYKQNYNDLAGILDALIDSVAENRMTAAEAISQFNSLLEKQIVQYRNSRDPERNKPAAGDDAPAGGTNGHGGPPGPGGNGKH